MTKKSKVFNVQQLRQYWKNVEKDPDNKKMSRGAVFISKLIPNGGREYWRANSGHHPDRKKGKKM